MSTTNARQLPKAQESLADYVNRQREALGLTRIALAERAGIHKQSLGKIERGQTQTLNRRTLSSLSKALEVPMDYLDAVVRGQAGELGPSLKLGLFALPPEKDHSRLRQSRLSTEAGLSSTFILCHILLMHSMNGTPHN